MSCAAERAKFFAKHHVARAKQLALQRRSTSIGGILGKLPIFYGDAVASYAVENGIAGAAAVAVRGARSNALDD